MSSLAPPETAATNQDVSTVWMGTLPLVPVDAV